MNPDGKRHIAWLMTLAGALVLSALLVLEGLTAGQGKVQAGTATVEAAVESVIAQPRGFLYRQVVVRGQVMRIWGRCTLALRSHPVRHGLLIVLGEQTVAAAGLRVGQMVEVKGSVRLLCRQELQMLRGDLGTDAIGDDVLVTYGAGPYVLAEEVRPAEAGP